MAIFMASTKTITRSKGQSAVASASYRAGVELEDKRYGKTHDYSKRNGVMSADIILPSSLQNKNVTIERAELWNLAEETETRKNSRVAREWLVNLPHELDEKTRKELAHEFTQVLTDKFGTLADCAIHRPTEREIERGADARNYHAHIMLTTRKAELGDDSKIKLTDKADCELSDTDRKKSGLCKAKDEVTEIRQLWETLANEKLLEHGHQIIDSRSYESQGIDILPQIKMGSMATKLERDGKQTMRGEINRAITERNDLVFNIELADNQRINDKANHIILQSRINSKSEQNNDELRTKNNIAWSDKRNSHLIKRIDASKRRIENTAKNTAWSNRRTERIDQRIDASKRRIDASKRVINEASCVSDFDIRRSTDSRERAIKQLAEQTGLFDSETKYANSNPEWRKPAIVGITRTVDDVVNDTRLKFVNRKNMGIYSAEQLKILDEFAQTHELQSGQFHQDLKTAKAFFKNADHVRENRHIVNIIRHPANNPVTNTSKPSQVQNGSNSTIDNLKADISSNKMSNNHVTKFRP